MTNTEADISQFVYEATVAQIRAFCEYRLSQGLTNDELNAELKNFIPRVNAWAQRQRTMIKLMVLDDTVAHRLQ